MRPVLGNHVYQLDDLFIVKMPLQLGEGRIFDHIPSDKLIGGSHDRAFGRRVFVGGRPVLNPAIFSSDSPPISGIRATLTCCEYSNLQSPTMAVRNIANSRSPGASLRPGASSAQTISVESLKMSG